jgi:general secretion pathway protein N
MAKQKMIARRGPLTLAACGLAAFCTTALPAATPRDAEVGTDAPANDTLIEMRPGVVAAPPASRTPTGKVYSGNPLWSIPLSTLTATRERPIFSPSRRPPSPVVAAIAPPAAATPVAAPPAAPPEPLSLGLVGTIGNGDDSVAVFVEQRTKAIIRLRVGEAYSGWILREVRSREASLEKGTRAETVVMQRPDQ